MCILALLGMVGEERAAAQPSAPVVYVISIEGMIDLGLAPFLSRTLREAKDAGADAVLLNINTFGGRVDAAVAMRDTLLNAPVRTIAYVNQRAISAGALIALACDTLIMTEGGTIGAATPVVGGSSGETRPADEKSVSYVRKEFRATAEVRKRPPEFAEAMVDADVEIAGVVAKGKLLTLTASEALEHKVAELTAPTVEAALAAAGIVGAEMRHARQTWAETLVRFLTHPVLSSLLMTVGLLGLLVEIRTPGFALPGTVGLISLGLFFWGHWIVQLAGWEEVLLISVGLLLIALEAFVIPGTSVAGIAGIVAVVGGLGMTLVGAGATVSIIMSALARVAVSILLALGGGFLLLRMLPRVPFGRRLVLGAGMAADRGFVSAAEGERHLVGRKGTALSPLRPAGIAEIEATRFDVVFRTATSLMQAPLSTSRAWTATGSWSGSRRRARSTLMTEFDPTVVFGALGLLIPAVVLLVVVLYLVPVPLWIAAWSSGAYVGLLTLVGMRLRRVPPTTIVTARISAVKAGLQGVSIDDLEAHYLAGGNVVRVVNALISADKANIEMPFKRAAAIDLAGRDVLEAVKMSVIPKVIQTARVAAVAKDGIQLIAVSRVTVRTNIDRLVGGAGEETIIARVGEGMVSTIGSATTHKDVLENPDHISKNILSRGLDAGTAYEILSIDIADVDVGDNIGAKLQIDQANADKQIAQAKAEERRAMAVALEQEMRARVVEAEAEVPRAMAEAFRDGNLGIMDYYRMKNIQADSSMRESIADGGGDGQAQPKR